MLTVESFIYFFENKEGKNSPEIGPKNEIHTMGISLERVLSEPTLVLSRLYWKSERV